MMSSSAAPAPAPAKFRFAIDRGGTFTDVYAQVSEGKKHTRHGKQRQTSMSMT